MVGLVGVGVACAPPQPESARPVAVADGWSRVGVVRETIDPVARYAASAALPDGGWLVVGDLTSAPGALLQPAAWRSEDGSRWDPVTLAPVEGTSATIAAVVATPSSVVAVGRIGIGPQADPAVWRSTDAGRTWDPPTRLATPDGLDGAEAVAVTAGPGGVVAGGGPVDGVAGGPLLWRSDDGRSWERVETSDAPAPDPAGPASRSSVVQLATSGATTVGVIERRRVDGAAGDTAESTAATVRSVDGRSFVSGGSLELPGPVSGLVGTTRGFIAVGEWLATSADGASWSVARLPETASTEDIAQRGPAQLAVDGDRPLLQEPFGPVLGLRPGVPLEAERLADTAAWEDLGRPADAYVLTGLAAGGGRVLVRSGPAFGATTSWVREPDGAWRVSRPGQLPAQRRNRREWITDLAVGDDLLVAVGAAEDASRLAAASTVPAGPGAPVGTAPGGTDPARRDAPVDVEIGGRAWWSTDGRVWTESILSSAVRSVDAVARRGTGFVAVGRSRDASGTDETLLLASSDGKGWAFGGRLPSGASVRDLLVVGSDLLAVGRDDQAEGRPAAWRSTDGGTTWAAEALPVGDGRGRIEGGCTAGSDTVLVAQTVSGAVLLVAGPGGSWRRVEAPEGGGDDRPRACATDPGAGVLVVGGQALVGGADATMAMGWTASAPGGPYRRIPIGAGSPTTVTRATGRWIVAGDPDAGGGRLWSSDDGSVWRRDPGVEALTADEPGARVLALAAARDRLVLGGEVGDAPLVLTGPADG